MRPESRRGQEIGGKPVGIVAVAAVEKPRCKAYILCLAQFVGLAWKSL
jgi:hypothetical protein